MEAIVFSGIQGTGKSSFYMERFFFTHVRINLDMLKTRHREGVLLRACIEARQPFVVDNTNPTAEERTKYIITARAAGFRVIGFYFQSRIADALQRNEQRPPERRVPRAGVLGTHRRLEVPKPEEGFDSLFFVTLSPESVFSVEEWRNEV